MALILRGIDSWNKYMDAHGDPRTKDWFMMSSPFPTLFVCLSYVFIVKVAGPRLMENRKPFRLQNTLIVYNALQVVFSTWIFSECLKGGWWGHYSFKCQPIEYDNHPRTITIAISGWLTGHYSFRCQPVEYNNNPRTIRMVHACWWYYFSKFTEFFDTFFFILRKKQSQVTTLHVIHHGCMPMSVWFGVKFTPGGHSTFFGLLNTFVHIIMYSYYMLSAMGPQLQKYLWWKKYLTTLQMVQFILIMVHAFQLLFIDCNYPKAFVWWIGMHAVMFFFLFNEFYKQAYKSRQMRSSANYDAKKNSIIASALRNGICNIIEDDNDDNTVENNNKEQKKLTAATTRATTNGYVMSNGNLNNHYNKQNEHQIDNHNMKQNQNQKHNNSHYYSHSDSHDSHSNKLANGSAYKNDNRHLVTNSNGDVGSHMEMHQRKVVQQHQQHQQQQQQQQHEHDHGQQAI